jgi:NAD(P)-dependent dehydrogenase (short-subunit alcohol dehydrogenase family)
MSKREEMFDLTGRVAIVTGGGRGIGRGISEGLAAFGAKVVMTGRNEATLAEAATEIRANGGEVIGHAADISKEDDVIALRDAVLARYGRIDVLVNNAGINPIWKNLERTTLDEWQNIMDTNLTGPFLCCKYLGTPMVEQGKGSIINISSVAGNVGLKRSVPYCASKGGVELLAKALALDWASKGVRVNTIAPGYFETDLTAGVRANDAIAAPLIAHTPLGRFAKLDDIAGAVVFLASDASAYVTGASLAVDGGWTAE